MNQSKFSLADVIALLTAFAFGFVCLLSANFFILGNNAPENITLAVIIALLLSGTAFGAKRLKCTNRNFKTCFVWEKILLVLFTGLFLFFAYSPFPHYFVVSGQKAEIQRKLITSITQAENMFTEYEHYAENRESLYKKKLQSIAASKDTNPSEYAEYGFENNGVSDDKQIENKMFTVHADLFPTNYEEMKKVSSKWLSNSKNIVEQWNPIRVVSIVNDVEQNSKEWLEQLAQFSNTREKGEQAEGFTYNLSFDDAKDYFTSLGNPNLLSIGLAILAYLLMILSYLVAKRRTTPESIFGPRKDNEL